MDIEISKARKEDFPYIQEKIKKYLLDSTDIHWRQFFVGRIKDKPVSFGRIIDRGEFFEIASLGVDYYYRKNRIGKKMLSFLLEEAQRIDKAKPIYAVTHVKDFAVSCGFVQVKDNYPEILDYKRKHCKLDESKISVMKWKGSLR
ncbi:MAG: GNAT family N-acetyltransferase [Candidatus Omnitrophota bacterium]|nr:MAG: GNAT family N-acetyltransferase [Candidatus Omnitrophota bacterium]